MGVHCRLGELEDAHRVMGQVMAIIKRKPGGGTRWQAQIFLKMSSVLRRELYEKILAEQETASKTLRELNEELEGKLKHHVKFKDQI